MAETVAGGSTSRFLRRFSWSITCDAVPALETIEHRVPLSSRRTRKKAMSPLFTWREFLATAPTVSHRRTRFGALSVDRGLPPAVFTLYLRHRSPPGPVHVHYLHLVVVREPQRLVRQRDRDADAKRVLREAFRLEAEQERALFVRGEVEPDAVLVGGGHCRPAPFRLPARPGRAWYNPRRRVPRLGRSADRSPR
jgi:hypothetical protein